jgi:histidine triad (HIT) family protein
MSDCLFCRIIKGEIPSYKVYEDDNNLAFLDIAPVNQGHVLVIPKKHYKNIEEISEEDLARLINVVKKVGSLIKEKLNYQAYNVQENNDPLAGQVVPHIHFHVIPRKEDDGLKLWPQNNLSPEEAEKILKTLNN